MHDYVLIEPGFLNFLQFDEDRDRRDSEGEEGSPRGSDDNGGGNNKIEGGVSKRGSRDTKGVVAGRGKDKMVVTVGANGEAGDGISGEGVAIVTEDSIDDAWKQALREAEEADPDFYKMHK